MNHLTVVNQQVIYFSNKIQLGENNESVLIEKEPGTMVYNTRDQ